MKRLLTALLLAGLGAGCGGDGDFTWTISDLAVVSDNCDIHDPAEPLSGDFNMTIDGSTVTMEHATLENLGGSTSSYVETDNVVPLEGTSENTDNPPCTVGYEEQFTLTLDDPLKRLDTVDTLSVVWVHTETDESAQAGDCDGVWFVDLPCTSRLTFTLTQQ